MRLLRPFAELVDLTELSLRRLASHGGLTLLSLAGIILSVGLVSNGAFFAQAVDRVILQQELDELTRVTGRPPFSIRVYFLPSSRKPLSLQAAEAAGKSIGDTLANEVGLPVADLGLQVRSGGMMLLPGVDDTRYSGPNAYLTIANLVYIAESEGHLEFTAGEQLGTDRAADANQIDVWMHQRLAEEMGVHVGESFEVAGNLTLPRQKVIVRGLWQARDPTEPFWASDPDSSLRDALLVERDAYVQQVQPKIPARSGFVAWQVMLDDSRIDPADASSYAFGFERGMTIVNQYMPGAKMDVSPLDPLQEFVQRQSGLSSVLLNYNIPAFFFLLYFLFMVAMIIASAQGRETALLVSRGTSRSKIVLLILIEQGMLFVIGIPLGIGLGMLIARWIGYTDSFLTFTARPPLPVSLQGADYRLIAVALLISLAARLAPAIQNAKTTVVVQAREQSRVVKAPLWQRMYLDLLLALVTYYAYDQLTKRGSLLDSGGDGASDLFRDPLLVLVPALFVLASGLLLVRIFPWLMRLLDAIATRTPWLAPHLALRQLGRSAHGASTPVLLVIVAVALGIYTYALATSLDSWLEDRVYFRTGADVAFTPTVDDEDEEAQMSVWAPPTDEFADLPGVQAATRAGHFPLRIQTGGGEEIRGTWLGIDRVEHVRTAWFRSDFAYESLGGLMNRLAAAPENVLVSEEFLEANQLRGGDTLVMRIALDMAISYEGSFTIAGVYRYFPTIDGEQPTVVGNLEHVFTQMGAVFPYEILLKLEDGNVTDDALLGTIRRMNIEPSRYSNARTLIGEERAKMERVGVFGTLTIGFLAAALMSILALLIYSYATLVDRIYQFGVLRAIGLERGHVLLQVVLEYGLLTAYGAIAGVLLGFGTAELFAPFFRIPDGSGILLPPLIPLIPQVGGMRLAIIFALIMVSAELAVLSRAFGTRLFDALRMGYQA